MTVAFVSLANNLLPGVGSGQVYVHSLATHTTSIAAINTQGKPSRGTCKSPTLSADGSLIAFLTSAEDMPGIHIPKKPRTGPIVSHLFAVRLKDNKAVILGNTLSP